MKPDRVLTINDYYDGPRLGIAELDGIPHIYEAEFDHSSDDYGDTYFLSSIDPHILNAVLEDWAIWCRWHDAFKRGDAPIETHPVLPHERLRHGELKLLIGDSLRSDPLNRTKFKGAFSSTPECAAWGGCLVQWSPA